MSDDKNETQPAASAGAVALFNTGWRNLTPSRRDFGEVVTELNADKLVGKGGILECVPHITATHIGQFMPPADELLTELMTKDRRSAKEWKHVNGDGVWGDDIDGTRGGKDV